MGNAKVRVYQENWSPFQNLPKALKAFEEQTGIGTELVWDKVGVGTLEHMYEQMVQSFTDDEPPYDLICTDEIMLRGYAADGRVVDMAEFADRDGVDFSDVSAETRHAMKLDDQLIGLPCCNVVNALLVRKDLLEKYGLLVPRSWTELKTVGLELQAAVRADGQSDFYGFATRGANNGHSVWTFSSFLASFGGRWLLDETEVAPTTTAPPEQGKISFVELLSNFSKGRVGMILEVGNEYAHLFDSNPALAETAEVALIPAGPMGRRPGVYCPLWSIPKNSPVKKEAWELARFLTTSSQLVDDGLASGAIEASSLSALYSEAFDRRFRPDLLTTMRSSRAVAFEERPLGVLGFRSNELIGDAINAAVEGRLTETETLATIDRQLREISASHRRN
jgi:multiple sugar transport system substrate-binding protein